MKFLLISNSKKMNKEKIEDIVTEEEFYAIAKTAKGKASEAEQRLAIQTIAIKICNLTGRSFCPENNQITSFNEGIRYVGRMILKIDQVDSDYFMKLKQIKKLYDEKKFKLNSQNKINT